MQIRLLREKYRVYLNQKFNPQMKTTRVFFSKIRAFLSIFRKGWGRPPATPPGQLRPPSSSRYLVWHLTDKCNKFVDQIITLYLISNLTLNDALNRNSLHIHFSYFASTGEKSATSKFDYSFKFRDVIERRQKWREKNT